MSDLERMFAQDARNKVPTNEELSEITALVNQQLELEAKVSDAEAELESLNERLKYVRENLIPNAMASVGMKEFKLSNGMKLTIKEDVFASIRKDRTYEALRWLDEKDLGGVIKTEVSVSFGRGNNTEAHRLFEYCKIQGYDASEKESVHSQTLKALVKEQMARGLAFPEDLFSITPFKKAVVK